MKYYLLDRIDSIEVGSQIRGTKCITLTDEVLHDHFPDHPILPGALIVEGLAQLAGFLLEATVNTGDNASKTVRRAILVQIDKMKFHAMSGPGDSLEYSAKIEFLRDDAAQVSVEASCGGEKRAAGKIMFTLMPIDSPNVTAQRLSVYKIWTRQLSNPPAYR
jgi:3-hydroxyacyl-[acyl-carrier-protein] dehydratase